MDLVSRCKNKLVCFRIKELKDVLTQLGIAKQGKKQDLVDRVLDVLSDEPVPKMHGWAKRNSIGKEEVAKIIDDIYRKMQPPRATDLPLRGQSGSDINNVTQEEVDYSFQIRCPCGNSLATKSMIQCVDPQCHVQQHTVCVIIPEKPTEGIPSVPHQFYCEICRISRADPFWDTLGHPLYPVKWTMSSLPADGTNLVQSVETTFQLTRLKTEYDVQAWCLLLNDKVPFRMQWPQNADLLVNGVQVRMTNRPGSQLLGANGRDDGPVITIFTREGINKIALSGCDARVFCLGVRIVRRRTLQQVLDLIPKEPDGERFEDALARVCRCICGGNATENADSDSDLEVVADSVTVNLRCPMSGSRMKIAGRFKPCAHMGCFDLETFVELNQRSRKWQCPICLKNYSLENIIIDPYFNRITTMMRNCGEDVNEIDVRPDGSWRAKNENEQGDLSQWHFPDGSLCVTADGDVKPVEALKQIKQEGVSDGQTGLKLGMRKNHNGIWEVSKPENMHTLSSGNQLQEEKVVPLSSSATGSCRDDEDPSVNQEGGGYIDFSTNNGNELDSLSLNFDPIYKVANRNSFAPLSNPPVIVLSDSEEENENKSGQVNASGIAFPVPPAGVPDSYQLEPGLATGGSSCFDIFNGNGGDFGMTPWPLSSVTQAGPGFQLFGPDAIVSDTLLDVQHISDTCPTQMNSYVLASETAMESAAQIPFPSVCLPNPDINDNLVYNPLAFGGGDPSLQIFLPTCPAGVSAQSDLKDQPDMSNGAHSDDWISLRLGGSGSAGHGDSTVTNGVNSRHQFASKDDRMESLDDNASMHPSMNDNQSDRTATSRQNSDSPFSFPRLPRSVRPRLDLCIELDSD